VITNYPQLGDPFGREFVQMMIAAGVSGPQVRTGAEALHVRNQRDRVATGAGQQPGALGLQQRAPLGRGDGDQIVKRGEQTAGDDR
jgi:hypothetical protein